LQTDNKLDQYNNTNIDLVKYQVLTNDHGLLFYLEVYGQIFKGRSQGPNIYPDCIFLLIDSVLNLH